MLRALEPGAGTSYIQTVELSRNTVRLLVALMTLAIGGVLYLQYTLLRSNVELKEEAFGRNALTALNAAADRLEEIDIRERFLTSAAMPGEPFTVRLRKHELPGGAPLRDSMVFVSVVTSDRGTLTAELKGDRLTYRVDGPRNVTVRLFDEIGRLDTTILDEMKQEGRYDLLLPASRRDSGVRFIRISADSATSTIRWDRSGGDWVTFHSDEETRAAKIIGRVAETATAGGGPALAARVRPGLVDTVLSEALAANGIDLPYAYAVKDVAKDSVVFARMEGGTPLTDAMFSTVLFPAGLTGTPGRLMLFFPGYRAYVVRSILPELLLNILFVLITGACFRYALKTLRKQREFAGRLTDFINNMTHEFKTPLSTIALSTEALARPDVIGDRSKVEMYGAIIGDEHKRMRSQVDRILELAALEEGEFEFRRERIDLHEVAAKAAANSGLRVKERGGAVTTDFRATVHAVRGDAVHIENVVNSVLDNAEKYSPEAPAIRVATYNADGCVVVSVADRGIGIAPEHLPNIFEKYFRVPTNNLHDVKGFGIGLSYVRLVVERHGGSVRAESTPGQGTTIELKFPVDDGR
jgi:two-component system phosphate regulon sensor histidine kinase PhoR